MILMVDSRTSVEPRDSDPVIRSRVEDGRVELVDVYRLPQADLQACTALHVSGMVDQEFLWRNRHLVAGFLAERRVLVFCGHLLRPWLPGCGPFVPAPVTSYRDYVVRIVAEHPVFRGVEERDLTYRRGVAGFFARGHHPPPAGAEVLATLAGGQPITWIDRRSTEGTIFVHAGSDLVGFADDSTASRLGEQLLDWVDEEAARLAAGTATGRALR